MFVWVGKEGVLLGGGFELPSRSHPFCAKFYCKKDVTGLDGARGKLDKFNNKNYSNLIQH